MKKAVHVTSSTFIRIFALLSMVVCSLTAHAVDYYWVEGAGNWSDINHWATTSGGTTKHSIVPSLNDNVHFDANSGFTPASRTVTINTNALCNNMTWSGSLTPPALVFSNTLQINGSLALQPGMTVSGGSTVTFQSSRLGEIISTGNVALPVNLSFSGTGGWKLLDSLKDVNSINFSDGHLSFAGQYVSALFFNGNFGTATKTINIANATINMRDGTLTNLGWYYGGGVPLVADSSINSQFLIANRSTNGGFQTKTGDVYYNVTFLPAGGSNPIISGGTYNKINFSGTAGRLGSGITTDSLVLSPGLVYTFQSNSTITVNEYLAANSPACSGLIELYSNTGGTQATIAVTAATVVAVANARIRDLRITGPAIPYAASSSIDLGNNTNWTFTVPAAHTYYWVGGAGNWNDPTHWASTSGGNASSGCVPTQYDNVIFDAGSNFTPASKTVTVNANAYCDSITFIGAATPPALVLSAPLEVHGSFTLQAGMTTSGGGGINFASNRLTESITTANVPVSTNLGFNGTGGWKLLDSLKDVSTINFVDGHLSFAGQYVSALFFNGNFGTATKTINIANATLFMRDGSPNNLGWYYGGGVPLVADSSINSQFLIANHGTSGGLQTKATDVYYNVTFLPAPGSNPIITGGTYNKITFSGTAGRVGTGITTDSLVLSPGLVYTFQSNSTITINEYLAANSPACSGLIELYSNTAGTQSTIAVTAATVVAVANARIRDLRIIGPAIPYAAASSIDLGNNTNWTFTAPAAHTYYWVGGAGNWNDPTHWASTSGGTASSGCVPTQYDNVIFDAGSNFTPASRTVTVNANAYCDSITFIGAATPPALVLSAPLEVHGSFTLQAGMTTSGGGGINFASSRLTESITTANVPVSTNLGFNGTGGWKLLDSLKDVSSINFVDGHLSFAGQYVSALFFNGNFGTATKTLNIANATIFMRDGTLTNLGWYYGGGVPLVADSSINSQFLIANRSTNGGFQTKATDVYNNVTFLPAAGSNPIISGGIYNNITFAGSGGRIQSVITDTLVFSANHTYTFTSGTTTTINEAWYASGNPCFPTTIQSTVAGNTASVSMPITAANIPPDIYGIDFVRMRDINAVTGADRARLQIGNQSINNGNNTNWIIIPYAGPAGITGLGVDSTALDCKGTPYTLSTLAFQGNPYTTYLWDDNSTATTRTVTTPGSYSITVTYGDGCVIKDTIQISNATKPVLTGIAVPNGANYDITLSVTPLTGTPLYTLNAVEPVGAVATPISQTSPNFNMVPLTVTMTEFFVEDQTTGCRDTFVLAGTPLPVKLVDFTVVHNEEKALLTWRTASEQNSLRFDVEQSNNGSDFKKIGEVAAAGNSINMVDYHFTDLSINRYGTRTIYYRLRQVDLDGRSTYSHIRLLKLEAQQAWKVYPVPFKDLLVLELPVGIAGTAQINLIDMNGRIVYTRQITLQTGQSNIVLSGLPYLPKGSYTLHFKNAQQQQFIKIVRDAR
ncbi:T9SS type A sorting domain-containing protein [Paraflavitalea pollutisoli]|uniref:T9SS type A sorting domain-containing protein n=1 Tax=Paraflavitalea pollutisoli TaxID=3034143 RepID=UPI0023EB0D8A|nr:T9SS type A sorting domain-containing protein [Paraflavitalea sp. H1-2-19X]